MMGCYVHDVPGRLRVKIPLVKHHPETAKAIENLLKNIEGIDSTAINTTTGSVVVNYESKSLNADKILGALSETGYFDPSKVVTHDDHLRESVSKVSSMVGRALVGMFLEKTLEGSLFSMLAVLI